MALTRTLETAFQKAGMMMVGPWGGGGVVGNTGVAVGSSGFVQALTPPGGAPPRRRGEDYLRSYATMPWLRAIVHKVSFACATIPWQLYVIDPSGREEKTPYEKPHPLRTLLTSGVKDPDGFQILTGLQVRMLTHEYMELRGEAFWLLDRNIGGRGVPVQAWPCPPNWIVRSPTQNDPTFWLTMPHGMQAKIPASEVMWFRDPDPYNPYTRGLGIAEALGEELSIDEFMSKHVSRFFWNSARPDVIVSGTGLNEPGIRRLEEEWNRRTQGVWNAFRTFFLSHDAKVTPLDTNLHNLQFVDLRKWQRDIVMQTFGVPPEIMGLLDHSNRSTIEISDFIFAKYLVAPRLAMFDASINARLVPEYDSRLLLEHDDPVPENREAAIKEVLDVNAGQVFRVNERRSKLGLDPVPGGDVFLVPLNLQAQTNLGGGKTGEAVEEPQTLEDVPTEGPEIPVGRGIVRKAAGDADDEGDAAITDAEIADVLVAFTEEAQRVYDAMRPAYRLTLLDHAQRAFGDVSQSQDTLNSTSARIVRFLEYEAPRRIKGITETTWAALRTSLAEGIIAGETITQLADRVSVVFNEAKGARAELIARTETIQAANYGALDGYRQAGVQQKEWLTAKDEKVCPICEPLDGEIVDIDEPFSTGDDAPTAHPACRCVLLPVIGDGEKAITKDRDARRVAQWRVAIAMQTGHERMFLREWKKAMQAQQRRVTDRLRVVSARARTRVPVPA